MAQHSLVRTNPKGQPFIGTCTKCGRDGITLEKMAVEECPNVRNITDAEALEEIVRGGQ